MIWTFITAGGWVMVPILFCSVLALGLLLERLWFWAALFGERDLALREGLLAARFDAGRAERSGDPVCRVLYRLHREPDDPTAATTLAERVIAETKAPIPVMNTIAAVSTSLGLFGTVVGVAQAFQQLQGSPTIGELIPALSVALNTTVLGLLVYVPTFVASQLSQMATNRLAFEMEQGLNTVAVTLRRRGEVVVEA